MTTLIAGGAAGLLLGIALQRCGLTERADVMAAMALRNRNLLRRMLLALGAAVVLTAFLGWLAVIDVDWLVVLPLHGGTILGAVIFGAAAGIIGMLPGTAPAIAGGRRMLEGLCGMAGCALGAWLMPTVSAFFAPVREVIPATANTLFRVTLDEPFLLGGGFLSQGCLGAVLMALALMISPEPLPEPAAEPEADPLPDTLAPEEFAEEPVSTMPQDVQEDAVVAALPGEEVVVVDTAAPEENAEEAEEAEAAEAEEPAQDDRLG